MTSEPQLTDGATTSAVTPEASPSKAPGWVRRWWPDVLVVAVLAVGLTYEFLRYEHTLTDHLVALVAVGLLGIGVVVMLAGRRLSRPGRGLIGLGLAVGLLFAVAHLRVPADPLVGSWNLTVNEPAVVTIAKGSDGYTVSTTTAVKAITGTCSGKPGELIAKFDGSAPSYTGQYEFVDANTCKFVEWRPATFVLGDGTVDIAFPDHWRFIMTKVR